MFKAYTQSKQDDIYHKLLRMSRDIETRIKQKMIREDLTQTEIAILVSVTTILGDIE